VVDVTEAMEGQYLTVEDVKNAQARKVVITNGGEYAKTEYGTRFVLEVNFDMKKKLWRPNRDTVKNLAGTWGRESKLWIGKQANLTIATINSKEVIIGVPTDETTTEAVTTDKEDFLTKLTPET